MLLSVFPTPWKISAHGAFDGVLSDRPHPYPYYPYGPGGGTRVESGVVINIVLAVLTVLVLRTELITPEFIIIIIKIQTGTLLVNNEHGLYPPASAVCAVQQKTGMQYPQGKKTWTAYLYPISQPRKKNKKRKKKKSALDHDLPSLQASRPPQGDPPSGHFTPKPPNL